ncbi:MAG: hypothetical protein P8P45_08750 [Flavobacteriales bacterium]|nr:hypothetical protein [Flavobacteriales bacterium]
MIVLRLVLMVALQALILGEVAPFGVWSQPQWALWALLMVPPQLGPFSKLVAGFGLGLALDVACGTYGHHMVAGTVLGGALPSLHRLLAPRDGYEVTSRPIIRELGVNWVLGVTFSSALLYHLTLMVVDTWHAHLLGQAVAPALTSACWTTFCCMLLHLLVIPPGRNATRSS